MTSDELIAKFIDEQLNIISTQITRNLNLDVNKTVKLLYKDEPYLVKFSVEKIIPETPSELKAGFIIGGKTFDSSAESNFTVGPQNNPNTPNKDPGWDSIDAMIEEPEFVQYHNEVIRG